MLFVENLATIS